MANELKSVKLINGVLHDSPLRGGSIILRGVIDASTLKQLRFDDYQREALPLSSLRKLTKALQDNSPLPDIEVGMRGEKFITRGDEWFLSDPCFVIDGQQRVNACVNFLQLQPGANVFLGATVHFATTKEWERERFRILNTDRIKVSPNIILRNMREDNPAIAKLYEMSNVPDDYWCLGGRISWDQNMRRGKLITALNLLKIVGRLHAHIAPGRDSRLVYLGPQLDVLMDKITPSQFRDNIKVFFDVVDEAWGVRIVQYRELSTHLHTGFLLMLAHFFSNHLDFWKGVNGYRLHVDADIKRKIAQFPLNDPGIAPLTSSAGASRHVLYGLFVKHVNSGRRTKKMQPRDESADMDESFDEGTE